MIEIKNGRQLNRSEFDLIMNEIWKFHRFGGLSSERKKVSRNVKYVRPQWDMRTGTVFYITFDTGIQFDFRESDEPMFDRIMNWLNSN